MPNENKIKEPKIKPNSGIGIIILFLGVLILFYGGWGILTGLNAKKWPTTEGVITCSKITKTRSNKKTIYHAVVKYQYKVRERAYTGDQVRFILLEGGSLAHKVVAKYPIGEKVEVYYNKNQPNNSVLEPGISIGSIVLSLFGFLLTSIGIFMLIYNHLYVKPWRQSIYNISKPKYKQKRINHTKISSIDG